MKPAILQCGFAPSPNGADLEFCVYSDEVVIGFLMLPDTPESVECMAGLAGSVLKLVDGLLEADAVSFVHRCAQSDDALQVSGARCA